MNTPIFGSKLRNIMKCSRLLSTKPIIFHNSPTTIEIINRNINNVVPIATVFSHSVNHKNWYSTDSEELIDSITYEKVCDETLESLCEYFDEILEESSHLKDADVSFGNGVLTINFGQPYGTYVINRQSPNRQIWLSSPTSGPKRYDFFKEHNSWIYKHDNKSLHQLLQEEIKKIVKKEVNFGRCSYSLVSS